jgi:hypothetical protein
MVIAHTGKLSGQLTCESLAEADEVEVQRQLTPNP